jgi:RNA polymerase sigma factor (sigma-70 family)
VPATDSTDAIEAAYRVEFPRLVAVLAGFTGDIALAEEFAQDALVAALRQWPAEGTPANPGAWLTAVAKRRAIDALRRRTTLAAKYDQIGRDLEAHSEPDGGSDPARGATSDAEIDDDRLRLIFVACHPVLPVPSRVALTLRLVGGLTVPEIARAYVVPEATIAQRIVRAKRTIARAGIRFEIPAREDRLTRLGTVLEVIYLIFNEGYSATAGKHWMRPELCGEALRLGRVLGALVPGEAEVHGLVALMELQSSRLRARTDPSGAPILLLDQDRSRWDRLHIGRGEVALSLAQQLSPTPGPYALQAAIAACHARSFRAEETDWGELVRLYTELARVVSSPVVELNRAVAVSWAASPEEALALVDLIVATGALERYHLLHSVRGDLLDRVGRHAEAASAFEQAVALASNEQERALLSERARTSRSHGGDTSCGFAAPQTTATATSASPDAADA